MKNKLILFLLSVMSISLMSSCAAKSCDHNCTIDEAIAPTCLNDGLTEGVHCSTCGKILVAQVKIPALGHNPVSGEAKEATCTEDGHTADVHCSRCSEVIESSKLIPHLGHNVVIDKAVEATCTEAGLSEGSHCETCGEIITPQVEIPALGHIYHVYSKVEATCTEDGHTELVSCERCHKILVESQLIAHYGHTIVDDPAYEPTCTESGRTEGQHCSTCGEIIKEQEVIPALGHKVVVDPAVEATCTENGLTYGSHCSVCHKIFEEQKVVSHKGHNIVTDEAYAPTCTKEGKSEGSHCSTCGEIIKEQEVIPALGHDYVVDEAKDATCTEDGISAGTHCSRCHEVFVEQHIIEHKGHQIVTDEAIEPTCTHEGLTQGSHCSTCGEIIKEQEVIPALGHEYVKDEAVESTCAEYGKTSGFHCSRCDTVFVKQECVEKKPHTKGNLVSIPTEKIKDVNNAGLFECEVCHEHYYDEISQADLGLPIMQINGDLSNISKTNKVHIEASYEDEKQEFSYDATLKWQGNLSISYPKKNYNIQFYEDDKLSAKKKVTFVDSWGKQSKYTLKANYIDFSQMRNVASGKIYGDIARSRSIEDEFTNLINGGAIDGFPIVMFQNGSFQGIYTLNIPKDEWLYGMDGDETSKQAILMANSWSDSCRLKEHIVSDYSNGWELEYCSNESESGWVTTSFNEVIDFINNNDGEDFINGIDKYINVPRAIDSMLYTWVLRAGDNLAKNIIWVTYDGVQWTPCVYDMDGTWGLQWDGSFINSSHYWAPYTSNELWNKLYTNFANEIKTRWAELRSGPLSYTNIDEKFTDFMSLIPSFVFDAEMKKWPDVPNQDENNINQISTIAMEELISFDTLFDYVSTDKAPYVINFVNGDYSSTKAFINDDYSLKPFNVSKTYSRDGDSGYLTYVDGQINFEIIVEDGYVIDEIIIEGLYKNFKDPSITNRSNTYRITKIASNLTITIKTKAAD